MLNAYGFDYAKRLLVEKYPELAIKKCSTYVKNLELMNDIKEEIRRKDNELIRSLNEFTSIPQPIYDWMEVSDKKCLILYGKSGTGKTELAKSIMKHIDKEPLLIRDRNALGHQTITLNMGIIFDDISLEEVSREVRIHHFDVENETHIRILYKAAVIPANTPRIFTTNVLKNVTHVPYKNIIEPEIERRVVIVEIKDNMQKPQSNSVSNSIVVNIYKAK